LRRRQIKSPNLADALACTFAANLYVPTIFEAEIAQQNFTPDFNPYEKVA
jgi:hypothetical protein